MKRRSTTRLVQMFPVIMRRGGPMFLVGLWLSEAKFWCLMECSCPLKRNRRWRISVTEFKRRRRKY
jgi:hypothetical protein